MTENRIEISLAKALKLKNRLAGRITQLNDDIKKYNSREENAEIIDVNQRYQERAAVVADLVELKTAITSANQPMQKTIYLMAERKALMSLLNELPTNHGSVSQYHQAPIRYIAQIRKEQVDLEKRRLETEIDKFQEELDRFNQMTTIVVDANLLTEVTTETPAVQ